MEHISFNQTNDSNLLKNRKSSPNFRGYAVAPRQIITENSLKIVGLATLATGLAGIAIQQKNKKEKLPTNEEFETTIKEMKKMKNGKEIARFDENEINFLKKTYPKTPELTLRYVNMKDKNGAWIINSGYDILCGVERYSLHPEFSETVFKEAQENEGLTALKLLHYSLAQSDNETLLYKFYNLRELGGKPTFSHCSLPKFINLYNEDPEFWEEILSKRNPKNEIIWGEYCLPTIYKLHKENPEAIKELTNIVDRKNFYLNKWQIEKIMTLDEEGRNLCIEYLKMKDCNGPRSNNYNQYIENIVNLIKNDREFFSTLVNIKNLSGMYALKDVPEIEKYTSIEDKETRQHIINMLNREAPIGDFINSPYIKEISTLLKNGVDSKSIKKAIDNNQFEKFYTEALNKTSALKEFFSTPDYMQIIEKHSQGKYQKELIEFFAPEKMPYPIKTALFNSGLSVEDFLASLKKISKSSFKLAYDTPNQYIDSLDSALSTPINGHYPKLSDKDLALQRQKVKEFFAHNIVTLAKGLKYIDTDTMNHIMDKRFNLFSQELDIIKNMPNEYLEIYAQLSKCNSESTGKPLSVKEKLEIYEAVKIFNSCAFDTTILKESIENNSVNITKIKEIIYKETLKSLEIYVDNVDESKKFNQNYIHLIPSTSDFESLTENERSTIENYIERRVENLRSNAESRKEEQNNILNEIKNELLEHCTGRNLKIVQEFIKVINNAEKYTDHELKESYKALFSVTMSIGKNDNEIQTLVKEATIGDFKEFINNPNNKYGKANKKTQEIFKEKNLNQAQWLDPDIPEIEFTVANRKLKIKMWNRNPYEDLFMGNKTSCCTAIGRSNGGATPIYIMSHCWNVAQIFDEKGEVVGMSRIFVGEKDGKHSIMMDNIELNNKLVANMNPEDKQKIRNNVFEYMHSLAEKVTGNPDTKVYFYTGDTHVPTSDLERIETNIEFVGENPTNEVYINSARLRWYNPKRFKNIETQWFIVPKQ